MKSKHLLVGLAAFVLLQAGRSDAEQSMRGVRIVDADGAAISGLSITVCPENASTGLPGVGGSTGTNGIARFALPRGVEYIVTLSPSLDAPYFGTGVLPVIGDAEGAKDTLVTIRARRCVTVHGQVVDAAGKPLSEVKVDCRSNRISDGETSYDAYSGSDGFFRIDLVSDEGSATVSGYNNEYVVDKVTVDLGSASNLVVVAHKKKTLDIHCRIVSDAKDGRVTVPYRGGCSVRGPVSYMYQIENGEFILPDLVPGDYELTVNGLHAQGLYLTNSSFKVSDGSASVDFVAVPLRSLTLVVKDRDSDEPISKAAVYVEQDGQRSTPQMTDDSGNVVLPVLPASKEGWLRIDHPGYMPSRVSLPVADESIVLLDRGSVLKGRVADDHGNAITNAEVVVLVDGMTERSSRTDKSGEFLIDRLPPGEVTTLFRAEGYAPTGTRASLPLKEPIHAVLYLGIPVTFSVSIEATGRLRERIGRGALVLIDKRTATPVGFLPAVSESRTEARINAGKYDVLCWFGGECFQVGSIEVAGPGAVPIKVKELGAKARMLSPRITVSP